MYFFLHVKPTIIGNAGGVIGVDFSAPIAAFQLDKTSMSFSTLSETQTLLVSTNDNKVYKNAYYSTGTTWNKFQLSGTTLSSGWITGAASKTLSLKASDLNLNDTNLTKILHVITYSCTKLSRNKFDCRNNLWQLKDINVTYTGTPVQAATPVASPVAGTYTSAQNITLTSSTSGASIYYTTNGTTPTTSSTLYSSAISISTTTTLKAIAVKSGYTNSSVLSATYTINTGTANTYYISTTGNDGSTITGSISSPWKTLAYACSRVSIFGSIIHVSAGTYNETARCNLSIGISIEGETSMTSIIKTSYAGGNPDPTDGAIYLNSSTTTDGNQSISYLKMDGSSMAAYRAIYINHRNNVDIHHVNIYDFNYSAIYFKGNNYTYLTTPQQADNYGNKIHDSIFTNDSISPSHNYATQHVILDGQKGFLFYNNTLTQTSRAAGMNGKLVGGVGNKALKIYNNTFTKNDQEGSEWNFFFELWFWQGGCEIYHNTFNGDAVLDLSDVRKEEYTYGLKVYDNNFLVTANTIFNPHMVTPITFEDHGVIEYAYVYNNYFKNTSGGVAVTAIVNENDTNVNVNHIYIYSNLFENIGCSNSNWAFPIIINTTDSGTSIAGNVFWDTISIYNNTILTTSSVRANTGIRFLLGGAATNVIIRNNLIQGFYKAIAFDKTVTGATINIISIENNLYYNNAANVTNGTDYGAITITNKTEQNNLTSNPLFVSATDFHLQSGSPAIDTGLNVGLPYNGTAPDMGVFESNYAAVVAATPVASPVAGTYTSAQSVTLTSATNGASIYYTTNGVDPTTSSSLYSSAIAISTTTTLKAIAVKSGYTNSAILTSVYTINLSGAHTYYVSPSGLDSASGDITHPWFTLNKAFANVVAGDTVYMRGGTYVYTTVQVDRNKSGTSGNMINIWAYPGETPILTKGSPYSYSNQIDSGIGASGIYIANVSYLYFKGLEISGYAQEDWQMWRGMLAVSVNNCIFENLNIHDNGVGMNITHNSAGNLILNSDFHHNKDPLTPNGYAYGNADGLGISYIDGAAINGTNTIRGCRAYWNTDDGFDNFASDGTIILENNWSFYNGYYPGTFDTSHDGLEMGNGNGFKFGASGGVLLTPQVFYSTETKRIVKNNVVYKNTEQGFIQNYLAARMEFYNNTSYNNGNRGFNAKDFTGECLPPTLNPNCLNLNIAHIFKNNISYDTYSGGWFSAESILATNTFLNNNGINSAFSVTNADFISLVPDLNAPRKADGSLPDTNFLHLATGSDLINKGTPVTGISYNGSNPDLGAFETN